MQELLKSDLSPFIGILLHAIGGIAAASFYIPFHRVKNWAWEIYWMVGGLFSWIIAPWLVALYFVPNTFSIISQTSSVSLAWTFLFGSLWGLGSLTFGLTMRYLGIALGYSIILGLSAAIGTLLPPLFNGTLFNIAATTSGKIMIFGVFICIVGVILNGKAGIRKESELSESEQEPTHSEYNFSKGIMVAIFSGVMSSAMAAAFVAGKPIAQVAIQSKVLPVWQNLPVLIVILSGGFITNLVWCTILLIKNRSWVTLYACNDANDDSSGRFTSTPQIANVLFCILAGVTWYLQLFFYGIGTTLMGAYEFSSWSLHMASIIIFSTLWGIVLKEWSGTSVRTHHLVAAGLFTLILSILIIGWGNTLSIGAVAD